MIPYVAYYIVSGSLTLSKNKNMAIEIQRGEIVGLEEVWKNMSLNFNIYTNPDTVLLYLDKTFLSFIGQALKPQLSKN